MTKNFDKLRQKKNWILLIVCSVILILVFCIWWINQDKQDAVRLDLYNPTGQIVPEGIIKKSDIATGGPDTRYVLTGRVVKKPFVTEEVWFVTIQIGKRSYLLRLGEPQDLIGVNKAVSGLTSTTYLTLSVEDIIADLKLDVPIQAQVVVGYSGQPLSNPECDLRCQNLVLLIDQHGQQVREVLEDAVKSNSSQVAIGPVTQLIFATR